MFKYADAVRADARTYCKWFEFTAAQVTERRMSAGDLAEAFCGDPANLLDGRPPTGQDTEPVSRVLVRALHVYERCGLVIGHEETRYTPLGFGATVKVAELTSKGKRLAEGKPWQRELRFVAHILADQVRRLWKPFAGAVGVAGVIFTILRIALFWNTQQAAIVGGLSGIAALIGSILLRARH